jgi:thymidine phosphorylase
MRQSTLTFALVPLLASLTSAVPSLSARNNTGTGSTGGSRQECVVVSGGSNTTDDSPAITKAFEDCKNGGKVVFSQGVD